MRRPIGRVFGRIIGAVLGAVLAAAALPGAAADEAPVPERRAVYIAGQDLYGGDIGSIRDTDLGRCERACLGDPACTALTFNTRARACFLKAAPERTEPYAAALSARMVETPAELRLRAARAAAAAGFLDASDIAAARGRAVWLGAGLALATDAEGARGTLARLAATVAASDAAADWLALAAAAEDARRRNVLPGDLGGLDRDAALNAYLRADPAGQAAALAALAVALEAEGRGRLAVPALRLAERLAPDAGRAAALERVTGLYGFRVTEHRVESDAAAPRLCIGFSEPLAEAGIDYAPYVRAEAGSFPVEASGHELCLDGLAHGSRHAVTLREGLPSAAGDLLVRAVTIEIYVRDRTPSVRFGGRAHVLPKGDAPALPVTTVNLREVALELYRIGDRNLLPAIQDDLFGRNLDDWTRARIASQVGALVWKGTGEVAAPLNEDATTLLPLGEALAGAAPGLYALVGRVPGAADDWDAAPTQWFVLTDLALSTAAGADGLEVAVRGLSDAAPRAGVALRLLARNNDILGEAATGPDGRARFDAGLMRGRGGMEPALLVAGDATGDLVFLDLGDPALDLSDRGVEGRTAPPPIDVFVSTERGAYRPGETVFATVLARDARADGLAGLGLTAIVTRPDGVEHARALLPDEGAGGRAFRLALDRRAMRGTWTLRLHADPAAPALAAQSFAVEDFEPERIDATLAMPEGPLDPAALPPVAVEARYLWGAPAGGLAVEGETRVAPTRRLDAWPGWVFGLADDPVSPDLAWLPEGISTDAEGRVSVSLPLPELPATTRPLELTAVLRLVDGSGRPVERALVRPLAPVGPLVGLRPLFDDSVPENGTAEVEVMALGADLRPLGQALRLGWTLSRVHTEYQWYRAGGQWAWEPIVRRERVASGEVATGAAPVRIAAPVGWGRYELRLASLGTGTPAAASLGFSAGWYAPPGAADTPDLLAVGLDRPAYAVGETARLRVTAPHAGRLTVEVLSDRVLATTTLEVGPGETAVELPVTEAWGPGAYLAATLVRPMDRAAGRNPARAMGIAWAKVDPGARALRAAFVTPAEVRPRGPLDATLRIEGLAPGETGYATIAAVDLGILNLTGFRSPDPEAHYFGQRRLGVELRDLYGRLIDGLTGTRGRIRSGGDGGLVRGDAPPPTQELVAFFSGPVAAGPDGLVRAAFDLPAFNGTVRLMAVVWSARGLGRAETDVLVRDPVVVSASGPRFLAPGDRSRLLLELAHVAGPGGTAHLEARASGPVAIPGGPVARSVALEPGGRAAVEIPLEGLASGDGRIEVALTTPGGERLVSVHRLGVRVNDPEVARQSRLVLAPGGALSVDLDAFAGLVPGSGRASVAVGAAARLDMPGLLTALDRYPWGCTEQIVSRALPLVHLGEMAAAMGLAGPEGTGGRIAEAIAAVLANQTGSGSFGLWRPDYGDLWLDAFATDFLARARAAGHGVPETRLRSALENLRNKVNYYGEFEQGAEDLAYALVVLAREGRAAVGDLRYFADVKADAFGSALAQAQIGLALAQTGDQPRADAMFRKAAARLGEPDPKGWRADYGSGLRDVAGVLALAVEARSAVVDREALVARLASDPRPPSGRSTQENAWTLLAARALAGAAAEAGVTINGVPATGPLVRLTREGDPRLTIANAGAAAVDAVLTVFGVPAAPEPASGLGYRIERRWFTLEGEPVLPGSVAQGTRLVTVLTVTPDRDAQARLIVTDPVPAGFEIDNPNLIAGGGTGQFAWLDAADPSNHAEFRTDRFVAAVDWQGLGQIRLAYVVRAVSPGSFRHPAASVEDMYRPEFRARTEGGRIDVTP